MRRPAGRRPIQVLYGGAHLFKPGAAARLGMLARASLDAYAPDGPTFAHALGLSLEPDRRRPTSASGSSPSWSASRWRTSGSTSRTATASGPTRRRTTHADAAGVALEQGRRDGTLPPFVGIRLKPFAGPARARALRTLERLGAQLGRRAHPRLRAHRAEGGAAHPGGAAPALGRGAGAPARLAPGGHRASS